MTEKKEPIVFIIPESMKDRDFKVAFNKIVEDMKSVVIMDLNEIENATKPIGLRGIEVRPEPSFLEEYQWKSYQTYNQSIESRGVDD